MNQQRGLESLLTQHPDACVVMLSEMLELESFQEFVKEGYVLLVHNSSLHSSRIQLIEVVNFSS